MLILFLYAGFLWLTAAGNDDKVADAKKILYNAVLGTLIILSAYALSSFIITQLSDSTGAGTGSSRSRSASPSSSSPSLPPLQSAPDSAFTIPERNAPFQGSNTFSGDNNAPIAPESSGGFFDF